MNNIPVLQITFYKETEFETTVGSHRTFVTGI